ncbi:MAG: cysteine--tRNA ligase [Holosporales bacterium]|nr:cysteine--tRNA ligase [Holosporales bacterium]
MEIQFYNSLSRSKEIFVPIDPLNVGMYVCGPTVYDFAHIGNARAMVVFDVLYRVLKYKYPKVTYVRNITDIDDKIYTASVERKCDFSQIAQQFDTEFQNDMASLNVLPPTHQPHATDFIPHMLEMIGTLVQKGFAYESHGHVLFSVDTFPSYGQLSKKNREELIDGARVEVAPYKKSPGDFVLWKPSTAEMPGWASPWGRGRPGWHIECSAMSRHYLGDRFDIHAGGIDLIFPHHENERAQSCSAVGVPETVNFWMHNGHLIVEGKKMSKSLGNFFTVRELLQKHNHEAIRLALLSTHYKQPLDWTANSLEMSKQILNKWYRTIEKFQNHVFFADNGVLRAFVEENKAKIERIGDDFFAAMYDDMNTPVAIQAFTKMIKDLENTGNEDILAAILVCKDIIGSLTQTAISWFQHSSVDVISAEEIEKKIAARGQARETQNFQLADQIRDELLAQGVQIEDSTSGTAWHRI